MLVDIESKNGNLLLSVPLKSDGTFDEKEKAILDRFAAWMKVNGRSIYGCTMAEPEFKAPEGTKLTQSEDGKRLYIHLQTYPFGALQFPGLDASNVEYAQFLSDGSEVRYRAKAPSTVPSDHMADRSSCTVPTTVFMLPTVRPYGLSPVIEVFLK